ncbi:hypothetical protein [Nitrospirillum iridis]|uniref:Uncharacterized protein n=1 Tax=Nitrospirillum iridis TaxID=765888 RepID=A0A7X0AWX1_9PROT|nr:hypothetical protein [Nitrospirillum iridis]MBB6250600.1 hypothetical protein [Nitrospirillum iridis]
MVVILAGGALVGHHVFHLPWGLSILVACGCIALNDWLLAREDELPGGFNNPYPLDVRQPSPRRRWPWWR